MSPIERKIALAYLEGPTLDWLKKHGDSFPTIRDTLFLLEEQITMERDLIV